MRIFKVTMKQLVEAFGADNTYPLEDDRKQTLDVIGCEPACDGDLDVETKPQTTDDLSSEISSQVSFGGRLSGTRR